MNNVINIKKGDPIIVPIVFKKKIVINNTIEKKKIEELSNLVKQSEEIDIISDKNN